VKNEENVKNMKNAKNTENADSINLFINLYRNLKRRQQAASSGV